MSKTWTSDDLQELKLALREGGVAAAAKRLNRPLDDVEDMARDLGWIESPATAPE